MPTPDREPIKQALAAYLAAQLQTTNDFADGKLVRKVYAYLVPEFLEGLPVLCVTAAVNGGSEHARNNLRSNAWDDSWIYLDLLTFVAVASPDGTQTQALAEARSNHLAAAIGDVLAAARRGAAWNELMYAARTQSSMPEIGNEVYIVELHPLKLRVLQ